MKRSLSTRLTATAVALVVFTSLLIASAVVIGVRSYLGHQLEQDVRGSLQRAAGTTPGATPGATPGLTPSVTPSTVTRPDERGRDRFDGFDRNHDHEPPPRIFGQQVSTVTAWVYPDGTATGNVESGGESSTSLDAAALSRLAQVRANGHTERVQLPGYGTYLVAAATNGTTTVISGLPTGELDDLTQALVLAELLLVLAGGLIAAAAGRFLVRRQLAGLRDVADTAHRVSELPLHSGEVVLAERVPIALADQHNEVGQVGSALNSLLDHVQNSLELRERSEQQVRQFVADASHELRTPLATIAGYAQLARKRADDPQIAQAALAKVDSESGRMTGLVEDLLLLARLDQGRPLESGAVDLTRILLEALSDARVLAPTHRWRLELPQTPLEVSGDEQRLHQVITNLLTNARKYTPAGTEVTVRARQGNGRTVVEVHDDGPGLDPQLADTAFDRFSRGDHSRTRTSEDPGGHGLGLSLVRAIIEAHGGHVSVSSAPGNTTFTFVL